MSCNNKTVRSLDMVGSGVATHQSLGVSREQKPAEGEGVSHGTISCLAKRKRADGDKRTSTQRDIEDKVLRSKEFVDIAVAGRVI